MAPKRRKIIERIAALPEPLLDDLAESLNGLEELRPVSSYRATREELEAIDDAGASGVASKEEVEAAFAKFRSR
jgi:hypothetical protein